MTVSVAHDADAANDVETVSHEVSGADYDTVTADDVAITVSDDETASTDVVLSVNPEAVAEDAAAQTITVTATLDHAPRLIATTVTVTVGEADDDATEGTDYETIESRVLYILAGSTSGTAAFTLTPIDDYVDEADETLTVGGAVQGLTVTPAAVTIEDNDERGVVVSATSLTVPEGGSSTYSVVLRSQPAGNVTVTVNDPTDNTDVTSNPASLTFTTQNWNTARTVTVSASEDVDGDDDTATITHTVASAVDAAYAGISTDDVTVTVDDDETASTEVILTVDPVWVSEGDAVTNVRLTATLNEAPLSEFLPVTVTVGAPGDTAIEGVDYETIGELTLNIRAGQTSTFQTIQFRPINTGIGEGDEYLSISGTTMITGLTVTGTQLVVVDDEVFRDVTLSAIPGSVAEDGGPMTVVVTATLNSLTYSIDSPVTVMVGASLDSAIEETDYTSVDDFTITIAAGSTSATGEFQLTPTNDSFGKGDKTISVSGSGAGPPAAVQGTEVTIVDDETLSTEISLSVTPNNLGEGADATTLTVRGTLNNDPRSSATSVTVSVGAASDAAVEGTDYETVNDFTLTIVAGQTTGSTTFQLIPKDDAIDEVNEALTVSGTTAATGLVVTTTSVTITDDDTDGVTVSPTAVTITEGGTVTYTVVLDTEPAGNVTVTVSDPTDNTDVTADPAALTFTDQNWNVAQTVTVSAAQDGDAADETATVTHTVASTADADYQGISTDDVAVTLEDDAPETVKVQLSVAPERTVTVPINKAPQGGVTTADYSGVPTSVTFNSTDTEKTFSFAAASDSVDDDGESVKLTFGTLPTGVTAGTTNESVVSITDDDTTTLPLLSVQVSFGGYAYTVPEGSSVEITINLSDDPERTVTIPINKAPQGGATSADYSGVPENVTFNSGDTQKTFTISASQDSVQDTGESVKLTFGDLPDGVTVGSPAETNLSITEDVVVSFSMATYVATEGGPNATVTVELSGPAPRQVDFPLTAEGRYGAIPTDWSGVPEQLTFNAGDTSRTFTFVAVDDEVEDDGEMVELGFGDLLSGFAAGSPSTTRVTLINDDMPSTDPAQTRCPDDSGERIVMVGDGEISQAGESEFWRVELDPGRFYIVEVLGMNDPWDVMGQSNPGNLTLSDPSLLAVWSGDGSERMRRTGGRSRSKLVLERASDLSGFQQFEVQSFGGNTGTYQIKVRVNNICYMSNGKAMYKYAGGPDGYLWDIPSDSSTRDILRPHPLQNVQILTLLGDNEDWYWESEPDEDWYKIEGLREDYEYTFDVRTMDELPAKHQATRLKILGILDSNGMEVPGTSSAGSGKKVSITFQPQNLDTYYISVGSEDADRTGVYRITISAKNTQESSSQRRSAEPSEEPGKNRKAQPGGDTLSKRDGKSDNRNSSVWGGLVITGSLQVRETLTADTSGYPTPTGWRTPPSATSGLLTTLK